MSRVFIPNTLRFHRTRIGLRQADVARSLGLESTDRISRWEKGIAFPHVINLLKLARLYGVHAEDLYPDLGQEPSISVPFPLGWM